jgi:hypothetical protein
MICSLEPKRDAYEVWELGMEGAAYGRWKVNKRCSLRFLELRFAALTTGIMECWKNGMMGWRPSGIYTPAANPGRTAGFAVSAMQ